MADQHTILNLANTRLEIVQGQIADLIFEVGEVHGEGPVVWIYGTQTTGRNIGRQVQRSAQAIEHKEKGIRAHRDWGVQEGVVGGERTPHSSWPIQRATQSRGSP